MPPAPPSRNDALGKIHHPPGFRARRGLNWGFLGLLYTSFYMCRYNLSIANGSISREFGFSRADMGTIITTALLAYAFGQIINGLLTDRIGGKRAMLIGAAGTIVMNVLFGAAATWGFFAQASHHGSFGLYENRPSIEFVTNDFVNAKELAHKLDTETNAISIYLRAQLDEKSRRLIAAAKTNASPELPAVLAEDFNRIIHGPPLYVTNLLKDVAVSRGGTNLFAAAPPEGPARVRANRLVLDEAYRQEIHQSNHWLLRIPFFHTELFLGLLTLFVAIRGVDGYWQAFGAPGMIKINTAWFSQRERGRFAGIYGFMINLGRFGIFNFGPALLAGGLFLGMLRVPPLHWRWLFWAPSIFCGFVAVGMYLAVKQTPEEAGFPNSSAAETGPAAAEASISFGQVLLRIVTHPTIWIVALAYACTGAVRQAVDQWFPRYMQDLYHMDLNSSSFKWLGFLIPFVASAGSLASGYISDTVFKGHRAPVAAALYFLETAIILTAAQFHTSTAAIVFLVLISLTANSTHSILGTAAAMDIGGRRMAGFASGVIDSFQYFGGSLAGIVLGMLLDKNLGNYFYFMAPFGLVGGLLMVLIWGKINPNPKPSSGA